MSSLTMWTVTLSPVYTTRVGPGFVSAPGVRDQPPTAVPYKLIDTFAAAPRGVSNERTASPPKRMAATTSPIGLRPGGEGRRPATNEPPGEGRLTSRGRPP